MDSILYCNIQRVVEDIWASKNLVPDICQVQDAALLLLP